MNHNHRLTVDCRIKALEAGQWQTSTGHFVSLDKMPNSHLINAILKAIEDSDDTRIVDLLAEEIQRRDLYEYATSEAQRRQQRKDYFARRRS